MVARFLQMEGVSEQETLQASECLWSECFLAERKSLYGTINLKMAKPHLMMIKGNIEADQGLRTLMKIGLIREESKFMKLVK
jgi:hypothetical protein